MATKYTVIVEAQLNQATLQTQLNQISTTAKPITVKVQGQISLSQEHIDNQVVRWNNALSRMADSNKAAFATQPVQDLKAEVDQSISGFKNLTTTADTVRTKIDTLKTGVGEFNNGLVNVNKNGQDILSTFELAVKKILIWAVGTTLIYGSLRQIGEGVQYIKDLNVEMTNIQIVTGATSEEISNLAIQYNVLARAMGTTTLEVARGSLEWARQGKSVSDTTILIKDSMMMSKLANLDAAQATEYMTSILNGFQLKAQDMAGVLDKLVALDNSYASSVGEIADAMQRSSNSAMQAGVSLNDLAAYITIISATTRKSSESIGESLKTMFARFQNIKMGNLDEDGKSINNVEEALKRVNIVLRDTPTSFRPLSDIISELAGKWNDLNQVEQDNLAVQIAGIRQRENFLVLMNNYNQVIKAQSIEIDSAGLATQRYGIYLDSIQAHANKFTDAINAMWQTTINSDSIKFMYDFGTSAVDAITKIGGLIPILQGVLAIIIAIKAQAISTSIISFFSSLSAGALSLTTNFTAAIAAINPLTIAIVALTAAFVAWQTVNDAQKRGLKQTENAWTGMFTAIQGSTNSTWKVVDTYTQGLKNLAKAYKDLGILGTIFNYQQKNIEQGLKIVIPEIAKVSKNWQDYKKAATDAAKAAGYQIDEQGKLFRVIDNGIRGGFKVYLTDTKLMTRAEYDFGSSVNDATIKLQEHILKMQKTSQASENLVGKTFDLTGAFDDLKTVVAGSLGNAVKDFEKSQEDLTYKSEILRSKIEELSKQPITQGQQTELFNLRQELAANDQAIADNAAAHELATKRIIFDMLLQRIGLMNLTGDTQTAAYNMAYQMAYAWGLIDETTLNALTRMDGALAEFANGNLQVAIAQIYNLGAWASSVAGDYYITFHVNTVTGATGGEGTGNNPSNPNAPGWNGGSGGSGNAPAHKGQSVVVPPGGWYPKGVGSAGGGSTPAEQKEAEVQMSIQSLLQMTISLIKQQKEAEIDLLKEKQKGIKAEQDSLKESLKLQQDAYKAQQDDLSKQLDAYKNIIDSRKAILQSEQDELNYQDDIVDKNKSIAKLQNELAVLALDTSSESKAKQLELQDDLTKQLTDLNKTQRDHSYKTQEDALDDEYTLYETQINKKIDLIQQESDALEKSIQSQIDTLQLSYDATQTQIDAIDEWLSKSGLVAQEALKMIAEKSPELYQKLIDQNKVYGSGIDNDVTRAWNEAYAALKKYKDLADALSGESIWDTPNPPKGISNTTSSNAISSVPPSNALKNSTAAIIKNLSSGGIGSLLSSMASIPNISGISQSIGGSRGDLVIGNLINVEGNVNKDTMPDLKKVADQVADRFVKMLVQRGYIRNAQVVGL
jgi:TP901 family phage tail tape measure protein